MRKINRHKLINITSYIVCNIFYISLIAIFYKLLLTLHYYYLFITIPLLFLFCSLTLFNFIKIILSVIFLTFGQNENDEVAEAIEEKIISTNRICKYTLIGIFMSLLFSLMTLDIIFCIMKEKYTIVAISIIVWILLYFLLFTRIVKMIRKEIKL